MEERLHRQLDEARQRRHEAERLLDPHRPALDAERERVEEARRQVWSTNSALNQATKLKRPGARRAARTASEVLDQAEARLAQVEETARPATDAIAEARAETRQLEHRISNIPLRRTVALGWTDIDHLDDVAQALTDWRRWANGHSIRTDDVRTILEVLGDTRYLDPHKALAIVDPLAAWAVEHGVDVTATAPEHGLSIDLDLGR